MNDPPTALVGFGTGGVPCPFCRLSMNDRPTALVGFGTGVVPRPLGRLSMNDPPTARLCENSVIKLSIGLESGFSPSLKTVAAFDQFVQICGFEIEGRFLASEARFRPSARPFFKE